MFDFEGVLGRGAVGCDELVGLDVCHQFIPFQDFEPSQMQAVCAFGLDERDPLVPVTIDFSGALKQPF